MYGHITVIYMYTLYQVHYTLCLVSYYKDVSCNWLVEVRATEDEQFHLLWAYLSLKVSIVSSNIVIERNIFTFSHTPPPHSATSHCGIWNILCLIKYFLSGWQCRQQLAITRRDLTTVLQTTVVRTQNIDFLLFIRFGLIKRLEKNLNGYAWALWQIQKVWNFPHFFLLWTFP